MMMMMIIIINSEIRKHHTSDVRTPALSKMKTIQQENGQRYEQAIHERQMVNKHEKSSISLLIMVMQTETNNSHPS